MAPLSEARKRANAKYIAKAYDRIEAKIPKGQKEMILLHAEKLDGSLNKFINRAIRETMERDRKGREADGDSLFKSSR